MVFQNSPKGCGKACVRDLLILNFEDESYETITLESSCESFFDMASELANRGLTYIGAKVPDITKVPKDYFPFISQIENEGLSHFVVVKKIKKEKVYFDDPQFGEVYQTVEEFNHSFTKKALIKKSQDKRPNKPYEKILNNKESAFYFSLLVLQCLSFYLFFYLINQESAFTLTILLLVFSLALILLQNLLNQKVHQRLEREILLPYLKETKNPEDYTHLSFIISDEVKRSSTFVSYGVLLMITLVTLSSNGIFFFFLALVGLLFPFFYGPVSKDKRSTNLYCTRQEGLFLNALNSGKLQEEYFLNSKRKAQRFQNEMIFAFALETLFVSLLVIFEMTINKTASINYFLFHLFLTLALSKAVIEIKTQYLENYRRAKEINSLSYSFTSFLLKNKVLLGYTNIASGGLLDGRKSTYN